VKSVAIQIQNRGTIAGNLCNASPAADGVLLYLHSMRRWNSRPVAGCGECVSRIHRGKPEDTAAADELLTAVIVPRTLADAASSFVKLGARRYLVISISMVAAVVLADGDGRVAAARVAVGSCSAVARRLPQLEQDLIGAPVDAGLGARVRVEHLAGLSPIDDVRATADYRRDASLTLVQRVLNRCAEKH